MHLRGGRKRRRNLIDLSEIDLIIEIGKCDVVCRKCHDKRERSRDLKIQIHHYELWLAAMSQCPLSPEEIARVTAWQEFVPEIQGVPVAPERNLIRNTTFS